MKYLTGCGPISLALTIPKSRRIQNLTLEITLTAEQQ
jgi:hypothetical protein